MMKIIADRYEILDLIGQGGMADVYLAKDTILNRTIAIKVLRTSLAKDPVYVTRFQREASAAAALSHKNIVEIYDVGEDNNQYYIVMEYVPGTTLKELINKRGALHVVEALDVMKQVVSGTVKAHQLGIVHRDLKPQNILVTDSGTAKIADFGIASMQSLAQVTQTDVIMGSLHYLAPELARGEKATCQSDLYALGIVLYELLRGEVPFNGESPVNIALKHMQEDLPSLRNFNASIPQSVENIVIKATAKNLKDRYYSAAEMLDDITTAMERTDEEKLVFAYDDNMDPTIVLDTRSMHTGQITGDISDAVSSNNEKKRDSTKPSKFTNKVKIGIGIAVALVLAVGVYFVFFSGTASANLMINLVGMTQEDAIEAMEEYGVTFSEDIIYELSDDLEEGQIIATDPKAGKTIKKGDVITLTVSKGKYLTMADYTGKTVEEATAALKELGFEVIIEKEVSSKTEGIVIGQSIKKDKKVDPTLEDKEITLTVSKGNYISIESYVGMTYDAAKSKLDALGFTVSKTEVESEQAEGTVTAQSKAANSYYEPGSDLTITLTVSRGISIEVDDVINMKYDVAKTRLEGKDFVVNAVKGVAATSAGDVGRVYEQSPSALSTVNKTGTTVVIKYYGEYVATSTEE